MHEMITGIFFVLNEFAAQFYFSSEPIRNSKMKFTKKGTREKPQKLNRQSNRFVKFINSLN